MPDLVRIGGAPVVTLTAPPPHASGPRFVSARILPGRGMMLLQARADLPGLGEVDLIASPPPAEAASRLSGDAFGNEAFAFGGAILAPFANRIRGRIEGDEVETDVGGHAVRLPANWGGKAPGAERYAMHGLLLDSPADDFEVKDGGVTGRITLTPSWPGALVFIIRWSLSATTLSLTVSALNLGEVASPVGIGWHPYFALPGGDRTISTLRISAKSRTPVNNYDEVLPTGEVEAVAGTAFDFRQARPLGAQYIDDCFTDLDEALAEIVDPLAGLGLRVRSPSPAVHAFQIYAPPEKPFVVIEPQFNLANPFGPEWRGRDTGMVTLSPGQCVTYEATVELFEPGRG